MAQHDLEELMRYGWEPILTELEDGAYRLTIMPINDFELYGSRAELERTWREALESHLAGYLAVGKVVPIPSVQLVEDVATAGDPETISHFTLNRRMELI